MKTSVFVAHFRDICNDLESINTDSETFNKGVGALILKYGMEELAELTHG